MLFISNWMVPAYFFQGVGTCADGRWEKVGEEPSPQNGSLSTILDLCPPRQEGDWRASLQLAGNNLFVLCPTLQLACLTWWTRHRKAPAIDLKNYKSEEAQINPANGESDLVESADLGDKEETGRITGCEQSHSCAWERTAKTPCKSL